jgi:Fe-S-cluster containining protein
LASDDYRRVQQMPAELREQLARLYAVEPQEKPKPEPCIWYDPATRRCSHYEWRPTICRDFAIGSTACLEVRQIHQIDGTARPVIPQPT